MTTIEIIISIVAVAFIALVLFAVKLFVDLGKTLTKVNHTLDSVQKRLDSLGPDPKNIIHNVNELSVNLLNKMKKLDPMFTALSSFGVNLQNKTSSFSGNHVWQYSNKKLNSPGLEEDKVSDFIDLAAIGLKIWQKFHKRS